jgi:hypothetical protein
MQKTKKRSTDQEIQIWQEEVVNSQLLDLYAQVREAQKEKIYFRTRRLLGLLKDGEGRKYMDQVKLAK